MWGETAESGVADMSIRVGVTDGNQEFFERFHTAMKEQYKEEIKLLRKGYSLRNISAITSTSVNTLRKLKAEVMV